MTRKILSNGQHAEDCECSTCELGGGFAEVGRQRAIDWSKPAPVVREENREVYEVQRVGPRVAAVNKVLRELQRAKAAATPPPPGGFRAFLEQQRRQKR